MKLILGVVLLLLASTQLAKAADTFTGRVVKVVDGER